MSASSYNLKQYSSGSQPLVPELKSGNAKATRAGNQQSSPVTLPQSNGVNITIINPTTNVGGAAGSGGAGRNTLIPSKPDSFMKSAEVPPVSMVQPGVSVGSSDGSIPPQALTPTPNANTPATLFNGGTPNNPQEHLMQDYKNLDNQYQNLQKAEQDYADAQKRYQALGDNVNTLAYQQNTGTPASGMPNATAVNTSAAAGGNPFIFPIRQGADGAMHVENPVNSGFPPGYSPYATYNALTPLPNSGGANPATPAGVFMNPADLPNASYAPAAMTYTSTNPPPAGTPVPNPTMGTFASVAPSLPPSVVPQAPPPPTPATPPAQQVIITPTMQVPVPMPAPVEQPPQPAVEYQPELASQPSMQKAETTPSQPLALPPSQQQPIDFSNYSPEQQQPNLAEQAVLDNQLNSVLAKPTPNPALRNAIPFNLQQNAQPLEGDRQPLTSAKNTSTNSPLDGFVPSTQNVPFPEQLPAELPVGGLTENNGAFTPENSEGLFSASSPLSNNTVLSQDDVTSSYPNNNNSNNGGSTNTMGLQLPPAYNQYPPTPQSQRPVGAPPPAPQQQVAHAQQPQQASFNATQVTPQDVAFFQEVLKMNPETAQVAGALPPAQIAQLLSGDKELLGTVRQIEGMLPPGTPPSALAAMMPPPPQGGPAPNRPLTPPQQQPQAGVPQQQPQRPLTPPQQQPNYGYAPQGRQIG